ncbi:MAG: hypothetical protein ACRBBW_17335 [Cellvibrionaceae bacterium]
MSNPESKDALNKDTLNLDNNLVCLVGNQDYSEAEIEDLFSHLFELTATLNSWVFYQRLGPDIGITTSGLSALSKHYLELEAMGCKALAVECELDNLYVSIIYERLPKELSLPIKISPDPDTLVTFLKTHVSQISLQLIDQDR